jgi:hypothetical protein
MIVSLVHRNGNAVRRKIIFGEGWRLSVMHKEKQVPRLRHRIRAGFARNDNPFLDLNKKMRILIWKKFEEKLFVC